MSPSGPAVLGSRITVVDDSAYNSFASAAVRANGDIVAVWYRGGGAGELTVSADIYISTSTDDGATWSTPALAVSQSDACRDPGITALSDGRLALTYTLSDDSTYWHPYIVFSSDGGATWGTPVLVTNGFANGDKAFVSARVVELGNGDLLVPMYGDWDGSNLNSVSKVSRSTDDGATWANLATIASGGSRDWLEPNITLRSDGSLFCAIRSDQDTDTIYASTSADSGATWTSPTALWPGSGQPACWETTDGLLVVLYRASGGLTRFRSSFNGTIWSDAQDPTQGLTSLMAYGGWITLADGSTGLVYAQESASAPSAQAEVYFQAFDDAP